MLRVRAIHLHHTGDFASLPVPVRRQTAERDKVQYAASTSRGRDTESRTNFVPGSLHWRSAGGTSWILTATPKVWPVEVESASSKFLSRYHTCRDRAKYHETVSATGGDNNVQPSLGNQSITHRKKACLQKYMRQAEGQLPQKEYKERSYGLQVDGG
jgi:hypothetical protein